MLMNESAILDRIRECFPKQIAAGALDFGDDAAILRGSAPGAFRVLTSDLVQEEIDFAVGLGPLESAGWRAISQNVSDLAAMGACADGFVWSLALPPRWLEQDGDWLSAFCRGANAAAESYGISLYGGDLSASRDLFTCSVTAWGDVAAAPLARRGATVRDRVFVSRPVGASRRGLDILLGHRAELCPPRDARTAREIAQHFDAFCAALSPAERAAVTAHLWPRAESELGPMLVNIATACMDISDGLALDLSRLCGASGVGVCLANWNAATFAGVHRMNPEEATLDLGSGEEYALLFTLPPDADWGSLRAQNAALCEIGEIVDEPGVHERGPAGLRALAAIGWDHFRRGDL